MGSFHNEHRRRALSWSLGVSLALAAGSALAADTPNTTPKATSSSEPGLLTFANVKVVNVAPVVEAPTKKSKSEGIRAFVADDGTLRAETIEERAAAASTSAPESDLTSAQTYLTDGSVSVKLNDEFASYQIAHKQNGKIAIEEATGKTQADKAARNGSRQIKQEVSNDR
jgi:hypothetical protein